MRTRAITTVAIAALAASSVTAIAAKVPGGSSEPTWPLNAKLLGKSEIGANGKKGAGDKDGRGGATVSGAKNRVCVAIAVKGIDEPTAAHIHKGKAGRNGPVVFDAGDPEGGDPGAGAKCGDVSAALFKDLRAHPERYYVNVHNANYPNGAIRGQLRRN